MLYDNDMQFIAHAIDTFVITSAMDTLGKRIKQRREELGIGQEELAKRVGFSQPTLANLEKGKNEKTKFLAEIARELKTSAEWLSTGKGSPEIEPLQSDQAKFDGGIPIRTLRDDDDIPPGVVRIRRVKLKLSAGISGFAVEPEADEDDPLFFREGWLEKRGYRRETIVATRVKGQSMEPTLYEDDTVLVNTGDKKPVDGEVYAVNYEGEDVIKRLVREIGFWWLVSDNPDQRRFPKKRCEGDACIIIGRVVHKQSERI